MVLIFGHLLDLAGLNRGEVRLLRHQDNHAGFHSPYVLWRDHRDRFEAYQSTQSIGDEAHLGAPYWASFVGVPGRETLFVGSPWRDLPPAFGRWNTVFKRYRDWVKADVFVKLFEACSDQPDMEYAMVDATIVKVHRHGQGAKGGLKIRP